MELVKAYENNSVVKAEILKFETNGDLECSVLGSKCTLPSKNHDFDAPYDNLLGLKIDVVVTKNDSTYELSYNEAQKMVLMDLFEEAKETLEQVEETETSITELYKDEMLKKSIVKGKVVKVDGNGNLELVLEKEHDGEVVKTKGFMKNENVDGINKSPQYRSRLLADKRVLFCTIINIDEEQGLVNLEANKATALVSKVKQGEYIKAIKREQKKPYYEESQKLKNRFTKYEFDFPVVKGTVEYVDVQGSKIMVNIYNLNMPCYVYLSNWTYGFVYYPEREIQVGDVVDVALTGYQKAKYSDGLIFHGSRLYALPDPWETVDQRFKVGNKVKVCCMDKQRDKFFGSMDNEDLNILVYYKGKTGNTSYNECEVGKTYIAQITEVDPDRRRLLSHYVSEA